MWPGSEDGPRVAAPLAGRRRRGPGAARSPDDDGTRYRILRLSARKTQRTSHLCFSTLQAALPFPIRTWQVDTGTEFPLACALPVQEAGLRLRSIKPPCPEQNGKVERRHRIDAEAFGSRSTFASFASAADAVLPWARRDDHER